jgi:dextransucrase
LDNNGLAVTGKQEINGQTYYFNADGTQVKNDFAELPNGSWVYLDKNGVAVTGKQEINGQTYYFNADGTQVKSDFAELPNGSWVYLDKNGVAVTGKQEINGQTYYFNADGTQVKSDFAQLSNGSWVYLDKDGVAVTGKQEINGQTYYFNADGTQVKSDFAELPDGTWVYLDKNGVAVTGKQEIDGKKLYFRSNGIQVKNDIVKNSDGTINYYTGLSGELLKNDFGELPDGTWVYLDNNGVAVTGKQEINGQKLYFRSNGIQVKGDIVKNSDGSINYYTGLSGELLKNDFGELPDGTWVYLDNNGVAVTGKQEINGQKLYFRSNGIQVKGDIVKNSDGSINYYTGLSGELLKNDFGELPDGTWVYLDNNGVAVTGKQEINGKKLYFRSNGIQIKGKWVFEEDGSRHYYDKDSGEELN